MLTFSAECLIGNSTPCGGRLWCLNVALGVCFWSDSDGERPKQIILGQMGRAVCAVCFWINTLFLSCSVSYLIDRGIYYCRLIALRPSGTRPSASGRICTCVHSKTDRAQTNYTTGVRLLKLQKADCLLSQSTQVLYE